MGVLCGAAGGGRGGRQRGAARTLGVAAVAGVDAQLGAPDRGALAAREAIGNAEADARVAGLRRGVGALLRGACGGWGGAGRVSARARARLEWHRRAPQVGAIAGCPLPRRRTGGTGTRCGHCCRPPKPSGRAVTRHGPRGGRGLSGARAAISPLRASQMRCQRGASSVMTKSEPCLRAAAPGGRAGARCAGERRAVSGFDGLAPPPRHPGAGGADMKAIKHPRAGGGAWTGGRWAAGAASPGCGRLSRPCPAVLVP